MIEQYRNKRKGAFVLKSRIDKDQPPLPPPPNRNLMFLHPVVRQGVEEVLRQLEEELIPFRVFEAWRDPNRQTYLLGLGDGAPGGSVIHDRAWSSYHQYGLAADIALFDNCQWSWDAGGAHSEWWQRLHQLGELYGLENLPDEPAHLQLAGFSIDQLRAGSFPGGGNKPWWDNLERAIREWGAQTPKAPSVPWLG